MTTAAHSANPQTKAWTVVLALAGIAFIGSFIVPQMVHSGGNSSRVSDYRPSTSVVTTVKTPAPTVITRGGKPTISFPPPTTSFSTTTVAAPVDMSGHYARQEAKTLAKKLRIGALFLAIVAAVMALAPAIRDAMEADNERTRQREQEAADEDAQRRAWEAANPQPAAQPQPAASTHQDSAPLDLDDLLDGKLR